MKTQIVKYYLIAGETSGDLHGSNLMRELKICDPTAVFRFWGGDRMETIGGTAVKHIRDLAFMGFAEVIANLSAISKNLKRCKKDVLAFNPDALVLIDYPGFNMRIAKFARKHNISVHYYISPQVWAWKQNRVYKLKKICNEIYCILPFEKDFYARFNVSVHFVGHPLIDAITQFKSEVMTDLSGELNLDERPILAVLPGSRKQEIRVKLPIMLKAAKSFPDYQVLIAGAPNLGMDFYRPMLTEGEKICQNRTYDILRLASLAMVTSGTATLETALFKVPEVVCYKGSRISYLIARRLIKVKFISLVNLIMDKKVVTELIQQDLTAENIVAELKRFEIHNAADRQELLRTYDELEKKLGGPGASARTAKHIFENIRKKQ